MLVSASKEDDLLKAAEKGNLALVKKLIESKVNINARGKSGETALMRAAAFGHLAVVKFLLAAGADIDALTNNENTALTIAREAYNDEITKLLIEAHNRRKSPDRLRVSGAELLEVQEPQFVREMKEDIEVAMNRFPPRNTFFAFKNKHCATSIEPVGILYLFNAYSDQRRQIRVHNYSLNNESVEIIFTNPPGVTARTPLIKQYADIPAGAELITPIDFIFADLSPSKTYLLTATIRASDGYVHDTIEILLFMGGNELQIPYFDTRYDSSVRNENLISFLTPWAEVPYQDSLWGHSENTIDGITVRVRRFKNPIPFFSNFYQERYDLTSKVKQSSFSSSGTSDALHFEAIKDIMPLYASGNLGDGITCVLPLSDGNWWNYQVLQDGRKSELKFQIGEADTIFINGGYHHSWKFKLLNKDSSLVTEGEIVQANVAGAGADGSVYIYNPEEKRLMPLINQYLSLGEKLGSQIVMDISPHRHRDNYTRIVHLSDSSNTQVEKYASGIGLIYLKKGRTEMRLIDYSVQDQNCGTGLQMPNIDGKK